MKEERIMKLFQLVQETKLFINFFHCAAIKSENEGKLKEVKKITENFQFVVEFEQLSGAIKNIYCDKFSPPMRL